ncbi:S-layer homology domain-containing protein [Salimicrobium halophilum]|uniref:Lysophospholipase L1 n=1 Tax=Salimicrobium halophilum TaxID=86666 RepID=A0A1G8R7M3_9BACI|nr:S-layer homology domain-containing protein [Salimicrobium halophilum]SDJ12986.1 Lysophospholipase L1 [Salimicrobium halophilum]
MKKKLLSLRLTVITMTLLAFILPAPLTSLAEEEVDYVALGDSLAFGVTPTWDQQSVPDSGYAHLLAHHIDELGELDSFTNQYSYPGYTTENVLNDLQNDVRMPSEDTDDRGIRMAVSDADVITISAGANDVISELSIDSETGQVSYDPESFEAKLGEIGANLANTVTDIRSLNPEADVYVMGYYNPYPYLQAEQQELLNLALDELNRVISQTATATESTFVPTSEAIDRRAMDYLPDPTDIHPNELGYQVLANEFWEEMTLQEPMDFTDVSESSFAAESIDYLTAKKILQGYDGEHFAPGQDVTRAEAILMLDRSIVLSQDQPTESSYSDIDDSMVAYDSIVKLTSEEIMDGFLDNTFRPDDSLTRGQMAKILVNAFDMEPVETTGTFTDVTDSYWASPYIETLAANEVAAGYEDGSYKPGKTVTRQELAAFIERSMNLN